MILKTLNGAPLAQHLDFSEASLLEPRESVLGLASCVLPGPKSKDTGSIKWRRLEARHTRLRSGWSQPYLPKGGVYDETPNFSYSTIPNLVVSFASVDQTSHLNETEFRLNGDPTQVDDFLQHSLAIHDTLLSSQIALEDSQCEHDDAGETVSSSSFLTTSFDSIATQVNCQPNQADEGPTLRLPPSLAITSLDSLPTAKHIRSIYPQTPTPTLLCVLTSEIESREVFVKKGGYKMDLFEITVADDTSSAFKISFWFRPGRSMDKAQESLRRTVTGLKVGDILLVRNVVLTIFRETVFGQSLRPNISKARTTIDVLTGVDGLPKYKHIIPSAADDRFMKVKRWARTHVVPALGASRKRKGHLESLKTPLNKRRQNDGLPPDTLDTRY